jgi:hypothetical protein
MTKIVRHFPFFLMRTTICFLPAHEGTAMRYRARGVPVALSLQSKRLPVHGLEFQTPGAIGPASTMTMGPTCPTRKLFSVRVV